jgi:probable addiction module antidote protein
MGKDQTSTSYHEHLVESLKDPEEAAAYLNAALEDDDPRAFLLALRNVAEAHGFTRLAEESGLNRQALYRALSEQGNPRLESLAALLGALGLRLTVGARAA